MTKMRYDKDLNRFINNPSILTKSMSLLMTVVLLLVVGFELNWVYPAEHDQQNEEWRQEIADLGAPMVDDSRGQMPTEVAVANSIGEVAGVAVETDSSPINLENPTARDLSQLARVKLIKVVDGDTIKVDLDGQIETVRLVGVDAPESVAPGKPVECLGKESATFLRNLMDTQPTIYLQNDKTQSNRDRYGRLLRFVFSSDGRDVGLELLKAGLAEAKLYSCQPHQYWSVYQEAELQAQSQGLGIWDEEKCVK